MERSTGELYARSDTRNFMQQLDDAVCEVKCPTLQNEQSEHAHFQFDVNDMEKVLNLTMESGSTCLLKEGTHLCYSS